MNMVLQLKLIDVKCIQECWVSYILQLQVFKVCVPVLF